MTPAAIETTLETSDTAQRTLSERQTARPLWSESQGDRSTPRLKLFWPTPVDPPPLTTGQRRAMRLGRADRLLAAGDLWPAGMMARVVLENELRMLCRQHQIKSACRGLKNMLDVLRRREFLPPDADTDRLTRIIKIAHRASHALPVTVFQIEEVITAVRAFCTAVRRSRPTVAQ